MGRCMRAASMEVAEPTTIAGTVQRLFCCFFDLNWIAPI